MAVATLTEISWQLAGFEPAYDGRRNVRFHQNATVAMNYLSYIKKYSLIKQAQDISTPINNTTIVETSNQFIVNPPRPHW